MSKKRRSAGLHRATAVLANKPEFSPYFYCFGDEKQGCYIRFGVASTYALRQTDNTRERVKSRVETHDLADSILFHYRQVYSVASRQLPISQNNLFRTFHRPTVHTQHLIDNSEQGIESGLDCVATINRNIAVQDLLQHFGVGHQSLSVGNQFFKQPLRIALTYEREASQ
jgi:hypothetical protein